jgi:hypothetical protein
MTSYGFLILAVRLCIQPKMASVADVNADRKAEKGEKGSKEGQGCKRGIARRADLPENVNREISGFFVRCHPNWETWEAQ